MTTVRQQCFRAYSAFETLKIMKTSVKNRIIRKIGEEILENSNDILKANSLDVHTARGKGVSAPLVDRLELNEKRIHAMVESCEKVAALEDPVGKIQYTSILENGLKISKTRIPIGTIGMIYESRPNVTVDAAILCLKSGNSVVLRGGSDAFNSNVALCECIKKALEGSEAPSSCVEYLAQKDRESVGMLMNMREYISLLIPRGGGELIKFVKENSTVPVLETGVGNCHIFVDYNADFDKSIDVIINAKTQRPGTCNSVETVLIHGEIASEFLPLLVKALKKHNVEIYGCEKCNSIADVLKATEEDWFREYLGLAIAIKIVDDVELAIEHINKYSSHHSESILTNDIENSKKFTELVDSAAVYVNASTRFTDGEQFGFGAEIGISTQRIIARGPVGLNELTTYKYVIEGDYSIRG